MVLLLTQNDKLTSWSERIISAVMESVDAVRQSKRGFAAAEDAEIMTALTSLDHEIAHLTERKRVAFREAAAPLLAAQRGALGGALFDLVG